jgi:5,10-methylenetetrahydromethanopterin reductase
VAIATLDEISDGRAALGIGAGVSGFSELGIDRHPPPVPAVEATVGVIRSHLREAPRPNAIAGLDFSPRRPEIPIFIAAEGPGMLRLAGRLADGVILQAKVSPRLFIPALTAVRAAARAGLREEIVVVARVDVSISARLDEAYEALRPRIARRLIASAPHFAPFYAAGLEVSRQLASLVGDTGYTNDHSVLERIGRLVPEEHVDAFCIAATPEQLGARLEELVRAGADQVLVHPVPTRRTRVEETIDVAAAWRTVPA